MMKINRLFLCAVLCCMLPLSAAAGHTSKMSTWVRQAALHTCQASAAARGVSSQAPSSVINAFVQVSSPSAEAVLRAMGCRIHARLDDIVIASIPLHQLNALAAQPTVLRIEANEKASLQMDTVPSVINLSPIYKATEQHPAFTGKDVVVGVMDVGFDLTHPNFFSDASPGRYRIGAFWDQLSKDTIGSALPVGRDFVGAEEVLAQLHSIDGLKQTHGTHTLGIAAGSGFDSPYRGVAFESDICLVSNAVTSDIEFIDSADYYKYTTATDALGFKYIFDYADSLGKPCVASFSEGYTAFLDEDDSLFCAFIDKLCTPGHIIVSSAGNEGGWLTYMEKPVGKTWAGTFINTGRETAYYRFKAQGAFNLHAYSYREEGHPTDSLSFCSSLMLSDSLYTDTLVFDADTCVVGFYCFPSSFDDDTMYLLELESKKPLSKLPPIALAVEGAEARVALYASSVMALANRDTDKHWNDAEKGHNILAPSCFDGIICVGSTAHRTCFTNYQGDYRNFSSGIEVGHRSPSSSTGPTINDSLKPDVMAPGHLIISSYSSYYLEANPDVGDIRSDVAHFDYGGRTYAWNANSGTSMACPVVAGTIALWLQVCPTLTVSDVRALFGRTCSLPDGIEPSQATAFGSWNNEYGYGEIDAYRGLLSLLGLSSIVPQRKLQGVQCTVSDGSLLLSLPYLPSHPLTLSLYSLDGIALFSTTVPTHHSSLITHHFPLPPLRPGIYAVALSGADASLTGSLLLRIKN